MKPQNSNGVTLVSYIRQIAILLSNVLYLFDAPEREKHKDHSEPPKDKTLGGNIPHASWVLPIIINILRSVPAPDMEQELKFLTADLDLTVEDNFKKLQDFVAKLKAFNSAFSQTSDKYEEHIHD